MTISPDLSSSKTRQKNSIFCCSNLAGVFTRIHSQTIVNGLATERRHTLRVSLLRGVHSALKADNPNVHKLGHAAFSVILRFYHSNPDFVNLESQEVLQILSDVQFDYPKIIVENTSPVLSNLFHCLHTMKAIHEAKAPLELSEILVLVR